MLHRILTTVLVLLLFASPAGAAQVSYSLITGEPAALNHYPGLDGLLATGDDLISAAPTATNASAPNSLGTYSYNAFDFSGNGTPTNAGLPPGKDAITFIGGSVTADTTVAQSGGGPIITGLNVSGSEPFPGHGAYSAQISAVNSGTYNASTHAFTLDIDFLANLAGGTAPASSFTLTGEAVLVDAADFATPTGDAYVDAVLIPLAQSLGASSLFFAHGSGIVPASSGGTGGSFPSMPIEAALVGITTVPLPPAILLLGPALLLLMGYGRVRES